MANEVFVDTAFLIALLSARDAAHPAARKLAADLDERGAHLVTTDAVLLEFANFFARTPLRKDAAHWTTRLRGGQPEWGIVPLDRALIAKGERLYSRHLDKNWSLTDCISMEVMRARGIREVATTDGGFTQAGFTLLL